MPREFVDTNVLVYAFDLTAGHKRDRALKLVERLWIERSGCVSLQVLHEFYVTATKKLKMPSASALDQIRHLGLWTIHRPAYDDLIAAIESQTAEHISFWDALILQGARRLGCEILWSEDFADGQRYGAVQVRNPFN